MRRSYWIILLLVVSCFAAVRLPDWWKNRHLITLDATGAEIYPILKEVSRQSGVTVLASTNTTGKVTVHFERVTLDHALDVLAEQTDGRWQKLYLMARTSTAMEGVKKTVIEQGPPFLITSAGGGGNLFGATMFVETSTNAPPKLNFDMTNKDLQTASLEVALRIRTPIALEEAANPTLHLKIDEPTPEASVMKLAQAGKCNLEPAVHFRTSNRGDGMAMMRNWNRDRGEAGSSGAPGSNDSGRDARDARREARQQMTEKQISLLTPEEQEQMQQAREERQKRMAEFATMTPEQRQQRMAEMGSNAKAQERFDQRGLSRIKNLTPEQRVERYQRFTKAHENRPGR